MITRTNGEEWVMIEGIDTYYGAKPMDEWKWSVSFAYRMVLGLGPKIAPRCQEIPAYASAPASKMAQIEAYVGIPLELQDGKLFGVLSGVNHLCKDDSLYDASGELELYAKGLMHMLQSERQIAKLESTIVHMESKHWLDSESGALVYDAWIFDSVDADWARVNHLEPAGIAYMDFGDAPPDQFATLVSKVQDICEEDGVVYRDGGSQFFVLFRDIIKEDQQARVQKIRKALSSRVTGSQCTFYYRSPKSSTMNAFAEAKRLCTAVSLEKAA